MNTILSVSIRRYDSYYIAELTSRRIASKDEWVLESARGNTPEEALANLRQKPKASKFWRELR
jgi:hypothetical protein